MPDSEIASSKTNINNRISGQTCNTITYPNCEEPNEFTLMANYIGGRICGNGIDGPTPSNYYRINSIICGNTGSVNSAEAFQGKMQDAISRKGWVTFLIHEVDNGSGYSPTSSQAIDGALAWAKANDSKIWVTTFRNAIMYSKERDASSLVKKSGDAYSETFTLTHSLDRTLSQYDYPLSICVQNSNNWTSVSATQDGKAITASIKDDYIYFDAVPNGGDIVLSNGQGATPPVSSSSQPESSSSQISEAIQGNFHWNVSGDVLCQVFDMKGQLLKNLSVPAAQGTALLWNAVNVGLPKGVYVLRYGNEGVMRSVQVRK